MFYMYQDKELKTSTPPPFVCLHSYKNNFRQHILWQAERYF